MKQAFYQGLIIVCSAIFISLLFNYLRPDGISFIFNNNLNQQDESSIREISIKNAYALSNKKEKTLFIDARPENDFKKGHIKGAVNLPEKDFDEWIDGFLDNTGQQTKIITYCDGIDCSLGKELAEKLFSVGYNKVYYLRNGWTKWKKKSNKAKQ